MIKFLGKGGAFDTETNSCAYFEYGNELYLLDVGENTFKAIKELIDNNDYKAVNILITHTHADHVNGLSTLCYYLFYIKKIPLIIKSHKKLSYSIDYLLYINGNTKDQYSIQELNCQTTISNSLGNLHWHYVETKHVDNLDCFGIYIIYKENKIYYSGDSKSLPNEISNKIKEGELTHYYQDISLIHYNGNVHMSEKLFCENVSPLLNDKNVKVFFYHNTKYNPNEEINLGEINNENI